MNCLTRKSKYWCFTINNYSDEDEKEINLLAQGEEVSYCIFGREIGAREETPHLQGYVEFVSRKRGSYVKRRLASEGTSPHLEVRKGTSLQASDYCKKDGDFVECGLLSVPKQGKRTDLEEIKESIDDGADDNMIAESHFSQWVIHRRAFTEYRALRQEKRTWEPTVVVLWGDTGTGKTRHVYAIEDELWVAADNQLEWFNGYCGQDAVLFDDFVGCKNNKFGFLLRLLDRYPMSVPIKGGFVNWKPKRIYITSNLDPRCWFFGVTDQQQAALRRRFTRVTHFGLLP